MLFKKSYPIQRVLYRMVVVPTIHKNTDKYDKRKRMRGLNSDVTLFFW